jgi:ABC-2 type transport system ATP-binding protein
VEKSTAEPGSAPALRVTGLRRAFDDKQALDGLRLHVDRGEVVALLGPNGAGKTTAMRCIAGVLVADEGHIDVLGAPAGSVAAQSSISYLPEHPDLYPGLTVDEHLRFVALAHDLHGWERRADELLARFALDDLRGELPGAMSQGMRRKAALSMALLHGARVLLLDEPFNGLDPQAAAELRAVVTDLAAQGVAVLISTHGLATADRIADRSVVMVRGRVLAEGSTQSLRARAETGDDADLETVFLRLTEPDPGPAEPGHAPTEPGRAPAHGDDAP